MFLLLLTLVVASAVLIFYYLKWNFVYWQRKGVPGPKPLLFFGNTKDITLLKTTIGQGLEKIYKEFKSHRFVGIYELRRPVLLLRDPSLIKDILVKDFHCFEDRGIAMNESADPLSANLINLTGKRWRTLRTKLTPAFTAVKIRNIFGLIGETSKKYSEFIGKYADVEKPVEFRDLAAKFTTEVISQCCFGLETNTIQEEDSEFRRMCRRVLDPDLAISLRRLIRMYLPEVFTSLQVSMNPPEVTAYFLRIVKDMIFYRKTNNIVRYDFMQLLMEMKNTKSLKTEVNGNIDKENEGEEMGKNGICDDHVIDDTAIAAQAYIFFLAGFETSSTTMSFTMYELAANPQIQHKLHTEISETLQKYGTFCYDAIVEMDYLDRVIRETLRKHPPVGMVPRESNRRYKLPDTDIIIEKGTKVLIPIYAIHHDPEYYPDPQKFDPDRFLEENRKQRENCTFLPFGEGPRMCIGTRFAYLQTKAGLVSILADYEVVLHEKTSSPLNYDPIANILTSKSGIWLMLRRRCKST